MALSWTGLGEALRELKKLGAKLFGGLRRSSSQAWGRLLPPLKNNTLGVVRVFLLVTLTVICGFWANRSLEDARCKYDPDEERCGKVKEDQQNQQGRGEGQEKEESQKQEDVGQSLLGEVESKAPMLPPGSSGGSVHIMIAAPLSDDPNDPAAAKAASKNTADLILKQSEQFQSWGVLILTGIIAVVITTKVHRTPGAQWAYLALGPAAIFLVIALNAGWVLAKRYTFLISTDDFSDWPSVAELLQVQSDLFMYAIICVSIFAGWFLLLIVMGKVVTYETKS